MINSPNDKLPENNFTKPKNKTCKNIMELLVDEEINRQVKALPGRLQGYIDTTEVAAYALNRLPPLYASSEKGMNKQKLRGQKYHSKEIANAVRQGLEIIQQDPIRLSAPLVCETSSPCNDAHSALEELKQFLSKRNLLHHPDISWQNLVSVVEEALHKTTWDVLMQQRKKRKFQSKKFPLKIKK